MANKSDGKSPGILSAEKLRKEVGKDFFLIFSGSRVRLMGVSLDGKTAFIKHLGEKKITSMENLRTTQT